MPSLEVLDVSHQPGQERLLGARIDQPAVGSASETYVLTVAGWAVGGQAAISSVEVLDRGELLARVPVDLSRPDVAAAFPGAPGAETSGFRAQVGLLAAPEEAELVVQAALENGERVRIGEIRLRRGQLLQEHGGIQPLLVTTLGRTGSTWLARLLGEHRAIVAYRPFQYEPRVASYWGEVLKILSRPSSYLQPLVGRDKVTMNWWLGEQELGRARALVEPELQRWLEGPAVEDLAAFCRSRIQAFYDQVAEAQDRGESAVYFLEKFLPSSLPTVTLQLFPGAREIFLVRDFRDRFCSVLAFNEKRGGKDFGARSVTTPEEHVARMRRDGLQLLESWRSRSQHAYLLRYEELIRRPQETLAGLLAYLGVDSTASTIDEIIGRASAETPEMEQHMTARDTEASVGRWRTELDPELKEACNAAFAELLVAFGYAGEGERDLCPPPELMYVGGGDFHAVGEEFLGYFVDLGGLRPEHRVLDVGCGVGRMAVPLTRYLGDGGSYEGFDIVPEAIAWCTANITARHPNFRFQLAEIHNSRYSPDVTLQARDYRFPYRKRSFDFVFLTSIFTHMLPEDVVHYVGEIARVLKPGGKLLATFYLLNEESLRLQDNGTSRFQFRHALGPCRVSRADVPEAVVAYDEAFVLELLDRVGLELEPPIRYGSWPGREAFLSGQDVVAARKN